MHKKWRVGYERPHTNRGQGAIWKGISAGIAGGLIGSWTMVQFQSLCSKLFEGDISRNLEANVPEHREKRESEFSASPKERKAGQRQQEDDATIEIAARVSKEIFDHPLANKEKKVAGAAVHYAFGAAAGAIYGGMTEIFPATKTYFGVPFAALVFLAADGIAVPALGLAEHPEKRSFAKHAYGFLTHAVFGATTELVRRTVRKRSPSLTLNVKTERL